MSALTGIALVVFGAIFGIMRATENIGKNESKITEEEARDSLKKYIEKKIAPKLKENHVKGTVDLDGTTIAEELLSIDTYPIKAQGKGDINIEIFSSPEKAGAENCTEKDDKNNIWLLEAIKDFNSQKLWVGDKTVSVTIRSVSSGVMMVYITSGVYVPDGITPSNEDWIPMLKAKGVYLNQEAEGLVKNTAGIVVKKDVYDRLIKEYGAVNIETVVEATINGKLAMGYTNPYASSTGLNFLMTSLYYFDSDNPLSDEAIQGGQKF